MAMMRFPRTKLRNQENVRRNLRGRNCCARKTGNRDRRKRCSRLHRKAMPGEFPRVRTGVAEEFRGKGLLYRQQLTRWESAIRRTIRRLLAARHARIRAISSGDITRAAGAAAAASHRVAWCTDRTRMRMQAN